MGRTSSIILTSLVGIVSRTLAVEEKKCEVLVVIGRTGTPARRWAVCTSHWDHRSVKP